MSSRAGSPMSRPVVPAPVGLLALLASLVAILVAWLGIGPLGSATVDPDATASVLYFQRLTSGVRLEAFVPTTPKPLLTLVYGVTWTALHDWRALVLLSIAIQGVAVGLVCLLVGRILVRSSPGPAADRHGATPGWGTAVLVAAIGGAAFVAAELIGSSELLLEIAHANALIWALAAWAAAGLAITARPARFGVAGVALLLAGLLRVESWLLIGPALLAGTWLSWRARRARSAAALDTRDESDRDLRGARGAPQGHPLRLWIAALALPIGALHDALLTGDPLFSFQVSARYTEIYAPGLRPEAPLDFLAGAIPRWTAQPLLLVLALIGVAAMAAPLREWTGRRWIAAGLVLLTLGDLALLTLLAGRGTYVSARYYEVADVALYVAAAVGAGSVVAWIVARLTLVREVPALAGLGAAAVGVAAGLALVWPAGPIDHATGERLALVRHASADVPAIEAALREASPAPSTGATGATATGNATPAYAMNPGGAAWLVPSQLRSRIAVDLDRPLTAIGDSLAAFLPGGPEAVLRPGQVVAHDRSADPGGSRYRPLYAPFEIDGASSLASRLTPLFVDAAGGIWVVRVGP